MKHISFTIIIAGLLLFLSNNILIAEKFRQQEVESPQEEQEEAEEEKGPWSFSGDFSQVFNQASFTNWAAGGEDSYSSTSIVALEVNYEKDMLSLENRLNLAYGFYKTEGQSLKKSEDRIDFTSKLGRKISDKFKYSAMLNYRSQFTAGYNYPNDSVVVSRFMAPGILTTSVGLEYKPWDFLSVIVSPVTGRFTFVIDEELSNKGAYGVDEGEIINTELGGMITISFRKRFLDEKIGVRSKLEVFNTYKDPDTEGWLNSVVNWESTVRLGITDYFTANLLFRMIYDHNIAVPVYETINGEEIQVGEEYLQFMQSLGLGFSYSF